MPLTLGFSSPMTAALSVLYGPGWRRSGAVPLTCAVLLAFLGLNVSVIGLVEVPRAASHLIAELFGLSFILDAVFASTFAGLERQTLAPGGGA